MFSQNELWMGEGTLGYKLDFLILETTTQATVTIYLSTTFEGQRYLIRFFWVGDKVNSEIHLYQITEKI